MIPKSLSEFRSSFPLARSFVFHVLTMSLTSMLRDFFFFFAKLEGLVEMVVGEETGVEKTKEEEDEVVLQENCCPSQPFSSRNCGQGSPLLQCLHLT